VPNASLRGRSTLPANALRLLVLGTAALLLPFAASPTALAVNVFWLVLLLAVVLLGGLAWDRPRAALVAGEAVLAAVAVQGLWSLAFPNAPSPRPRVGPEYGVSWRLAFAGQEEALMKLLPLPNGWETQPVYLRVDLGSDYKGDAGFAVAVNGHDAGVLNARTADPGFKTPGIPSWAMRLPREALVGAPLVQIVLRPAGIDRRLTVPGHGDFRAEPFGPANSRFFDGVTWHEDRLAGPHAGPASGTYRIWLDASVGAW
jgi:hypothetical protein